jgi:hypothetical protein
MHEVRKSLEGVAIAADGASFWTPDFVERSSQRRRARTA